MTPLFTALPNSVIALLLLGCVTIGVHVTIGVLVYRFCQYTSGYYHAVYFNAPPASGPELYRVLGGAFDGAPLFLLATMWPVPVLYIVLATTRWWFSRRFCQEPSNPWQRGRQAGLLEQRAQKLVEGNPALTIRAARAIISLDKESV